MFSQKIGLERDAAALKREVKERDAALADKEARVLELRRKNGELEKARFVLDFRARELRAAAGPREEAAARLKQVPGACLRARA